MGNGSGHRAAQMAAKRDGDEHGTAHNGKFTPGAARNFISERAVKSWTRGNAPGVPSIAYRASANPAYIAKAQRDGIDVGQVGRSSLFRGAYFLAHPARESALGMNLYGDHEVRVAIRMRNPIVFDQKGWVRFARQVARKLPGGINDPKLPDAITHAIRARGHDGVIRDVGIMGDSRLDHEIIAIVPGSVRVIREGAASPRPTAGSA